MVSIPLNKNNSLHNKQHNVNNNNNNNNKQAQQTCSQATKSKGHRIKTMLKNPYLRRDLGGTGQGCSDSSKNTQPRFVFSGDLGPEGGGPTSARFWATCTDPKTIQNHPNM